MKRRRRELAETPPRPPADYALASWLYVRLLGVTYLIAFASLWSQMEGLFGEAGILPVRKYLEVVSAQLGAPERFWRVPSLAWFWSSDAALDLFCAAGVVLALVLVAGWLQRPVLVTLWVLYLSLVAVGQDFLSFQWDVLLLEMGLLAIFLVPGWRRSRPLPPQPSKLALWLHWWLLLRFMLSSGIVKLTFGDPEWRGLTALEHHYETQPIPNPVAWFMHQLPSSMHTASAVAMFAIELAVPLLILGPARLKRWAAAALVALQVVIAVTGNYAFFNFATIALCLLLVDDDGWRRLVPSLPRRPYKQKLAFSRRDLVVAPLALVVVIVSAVHLAGAFRKAPPWPAREVALAVAPLRSINGYGLFRVMTTERPEIVVEGSFDGRNWRQYELRFKPGALDRRPPFVAPHQPRLDWQMWFAALGEARDSPWFFFFMARLAEGSPEVLELLETDPFEGRKPRYVRARLWSYRFTTPEERAATGEWWAREFHGIFLPRTESAALVRLFPDGK